MAAHTQVLPNGYLNNGFPRPSGLPMDTLQRAVSDLSLELKKENIVDPARQLPPISEVEKAACECCGMSEDFTPQYIKNVREKYCGRWICGLCAVAVDEEVGRLGKDAIHEALNSHMAVCVRFNRVARANPAMFLADGMREILKRGMRGRSQSARVRNCTGQKPPLIMRSSSCIPAISGEEARAHLNSH
ncbi:uncharacterized protein LOC116246045 [Nymphaea colorata]|nr:uncharacterized protein LOC116246045 [Nymphaea colorata]